MRTDTTTAGLDAGQLLQAAEAGAGYLAQNLQPHGPFVARRHARTGQPIPGPYDVRRHFGALWAMLDLRGHDPAGQAAAARAVEWAINKYYQRTPQGGAFRQDGWLNTGCSGLALLALDELAPEHVRAVADGVAPELVEFLLANQITEGVRRHDFPHRIALRELTVDLARGNVIVRPRIAPQRSIHYTGEILFGLITHLAAVADSPDRGRFMPIHAAVGQAMDALMARDYGVRQQSPWIMCAIRGYAELTDRLLIAAGPADVEVAPPRHRELLAWSSRIVAGALAAAGHEPEPRTVPTAGRLQILVQFLDLLGCCPAEPVDEPRWRGLAGSARYQLERDCALLLRRQGAATGGFVGSAEEPVLQIDATRHAISALLGAALLIGG